MGMHVNSALISESVHVLDKMHALIPEFLLGGYGVFLFINPFLQLWSFFLILAH